MMLLVMKWDLRAWLKFSPGLPHLNCSIRNLFLKFSDKFRENCGLVSKKAKTTKGSNFRMYLFISSLNHLKKCSEITFLGREFMKTSRFEKSSWELVLLIRLFRAMYFRVSSWVSLIMCFHCLLFTLSCKWSRAGSWSKPKSSWD